jgi:hypothetical protein
MKTVKTSVLRLNALAKKLRTKRISDGALRIELPRMRFDLMRPGDTPKPKIPPNYKKPHTPTNFEGAIFEAIEAEYFVDKESDTKAEVNLSDAKQKESELWMPRGVEAERVSILSS